MSSKSQNCHLSEFQPRVSRLPPIIQRRGAKSRLRQRKRSISQTAGVFICPRDVMLREPNQETTGAVTCRGWPRTVWVGWCEQASRRRENGLEYYRRFNVVRLLRRRRTFLRGNLLASLANRVRKSSDLSWVSFKFQSSKRHPRAKVTATSGVFQSLENVGGHDARKRIS